MSSAFQRLQALLLSRNDIETFLQQLAELAGGVVDPPAPCGITLRREGRNSTVASSDERASLLDETQYEKAEGPCLQSLHTGTTVVVRDVSKELRWPKYVDVAREHGLRSSLSLPLTTQSGTLGAMNIYSFDAEDVFTGERRQRCEVFAAQASGALELASTQARDDEVQVQLEQALRSRTVIDQALGVLMGQQRCTADEAFALLRMRSQSSHAKLHDVAADLVQRVSGQPPQPGKGFDRT